MAYVGAFNLNPGLTPTSEPLDLSITQGNPAWVSLGGIPTLLPREEVGKRVYFMCLLVDTGIICLGIWLKREFLPLGEGRFSLLLERRGRVGFWMHLNEFPNAWYTNYLPSCPVPSTTQDLVQNLWLLTKLGAGPGTEHTQSPASSNPAKITCHPGS